MKLNEKELAKLPKLDMLCLTAYANSLESIEDYEKKIAEITGYNLRKDISYRILNLVKETHESYANILLNILTELPMIKKEFLKKNLKSTTAKKKRIG